MSLMFFVSSITAAGVDEEVLKGLSREDLKDLFPGPQNFLRRKKIWDVISQNAQIAVSNHP